VQPAAARSARPLMAAAAMLVLLAAAIGGWFALRGENAPGTDRIAVLPITDISGSDAQFVEAMHDQLITALGQTAGISASPRSATVGYRTAPKPMGEVAQELGVGAVLEGTVFRTGDRMRINVQLVDPRSIRQLWSQSYEIDVQDVLASQDAVVRQIADGVRQIVAAPAMD
jgi:adenylate cyclase